MLLADVYSFVRTSLDSDDTELTDDLLKIWMQQAISRIKDVILPTSTLDTTWELAVVAGTQNYPLSAFSPAIDVVSAITSPHWMMQHIEHEAAEHLWQWNQSDTGDGFFMPRNTGNSSHWSVYGGNSTSTGSTPSIYFWPVPATTETYQVRGQRDLDITAQIDPDLNGEYHPLICQYMCARANEMQTNVTVAAMQFNRFEAELQDKSRQQRRQELQGVTTIGGEKYDLAFFYPPMDRLKFPFE